MINMFFAYIIKSGEFNYYYKGHTSNLEKRLGEHNSGMTKSIKKYAPFILVYIEQFETEKEAIEREKYFKTAAGRRYLKSRILVP